MVDGVPKAWLTGWSWEEGVPNLGLEPPGAPLACRCPPLTSDLREPTQTKAWGPPSYTPACSCASLRAGGMGVGELPPTFHEIPSLSPSRLLHLLHLMLPEF